MTLEQGGFLLVLTLACYRLARLISMDTITAPLREPVITRAVGKPPWSRAWFFAELLTCSRCVGVWGAALLAFAMRPPSVLDYFIYWLALAGGQAYLASRAGE
jgi:hypothetical protein